MMAAARRLADVVGVASAAEAIERLEAEPFDLVLSDTELGSGHDGHWLLAEVERRWPAVRRCLMSGKSQETTHPFLLKPVSSIDLACVIRDPSSGVFALAIDAPPRSGTG